MPSFHQTIIVGNLGADPEMRYTANGNSVTTFNVAVNEQWTAGSGERQQRTEWYSCVMWGRLAEIASQYLSKGSPVMVVGRMQTRSWDGNDGQKHYRTELVGQSMQLLGSREGGREYAGAGQYDNAGGGHLARAAQQAAAGLPIDDAEGDIDADDLPF